MPAKEAKARININNLLQTVTLVNGYITEKDNGQDSEGVWGMIKKY